MFCLGVRRTRRAKQPIPYSLFPYSLIPLFPYSLIPYPLFPYFLIPLFPYSLPLIPYSLFTYGGLTHHERGDRIDKG